MKDRSTPILCLHNGYLGFAAAVAAWILGLVFGPAAHAQAPVRYTSRDVVIEVPDSGGVQLAGTLTVPDG